ncbi:hypothetical protein ACTND8_05970 [Atopobiaceae bacterium HCP3S3_F7]
MTDIDVKPEMIEKAAKALADDWNPERDPVLAAMFRDYAQTALTAVLPEVIRQAKTEALEAVLREHPRVGIFEPCIPGECDGHEVNHDHMETDGGEWVHVDERVGWVCTICRYDDGEPFDWPCTTVRVITDALGVES